MDVLLLILLNVILPLFSLIIAGGVLHRIFHFDMNTLSKLTTYFFIPTVSFLNIYQSEMKGETLLMVLGFLIFQSACLILLSAVIVRIAKLDRSMSAVFKNSVVLINSANYGLPVSQLVFQHNPIGQSIQIIVIIYQNLLTYTYGLMNSVSGQAKGMDTVKILLKNPIIYAVLLGMILNVSNIHIPSFLLNPIENSANAFIAVALLTLGAQSAYLKLNHFSKPLILSLITRLIGAPLIAFVIIMLLNIDGTVAQALLIASSFPTSRNSALFALEYNNHPEYAAQAVLVSTIFSIATVTAVVYAAELLF
ncbi:MAG TPA: AEC family transporter [Chondromyces sp.]|nr:AEC family transporter [Chondromyces sp.]